jgi:hypothetical protein
MFSNASSTSIVLFMSGSAHPVVGLLGASPIELHRAIGLITRGSRVSLECAGPLGVVSKKGVKLLCKCECIGLLEILIEVSY